MKKKVLSLILATLLIAAMAIPVSASQYSSWGYYNDTAYYEIVDNCYSNRFSSTTICSEYAVYSNVKAFFTAGDSRMFYGTEAYGASSTDGRVYDFVISRIECTHYVNGVVVRTQSVGV